MDRAQFATLAQGFGRVFYGFSPGYGCCFVSLTRPRHLVLLSWLIVGAFGKPSMVEFNQCCSLGRDDWGGGRGGRLQNRQAGQHTMSWLLMGVSGVRSMANITEIGRFGFHKFPKKPMSGSWLVL